MAKFNYKCSRCGYEVETDRPPAGKVCPLCGARLVFKGFGQALMHFMGL
jgi:DNA-directed RNA polymerase subunit RPC12/RpoP